MSSGPSGSSSLPRSCTPTRSQSSDAATTTLDKSLWSTENTPDQSPKDWLREAVRMLNSAERLARAAHLAFRSSSALLRPAENLVSASAISLGSAANCIIAASTHLCSLAKGPDSPVPDLFFAIRAAAISECTGTSFLSSQMTSLGGAMNSTAISLALAAASFEEAALTAMVSSSNRQRRDRDRSRSPHHGNPSDLVSSSGTARSDSSSSGTRAENLCEGAPSDGTSHQRNERNRTPRKRNAKISHILIKHKESRRPIDNNDKPVTRTKDQAMRMVIDIHKKISRDLITFADAAFKYSECTSARHQGDIQKQFETGRVQKSFENAALALVPGQVSNIIESNSGYHILQRRE